MLAALRNLALHKPRFAQGGPHELCGPPIAIKPNSDAWICPANRVPNNRNLQKNSKIWKLVVYAEMISEALQSLPFANPHQIFYPISLVD